MVDVAEVYKVIRPKRRDVTRSLPISGVAHLSKSREETHSVRNINRCLLDRGLQVREDRRVGQPHDSLRQCTNDPGTGKTYEYIVPREFRGDGPRTLAPAEFGYIGEQEAEAEVAPTPEPNQELNVAEELTKEEPNREVVKQAWDSCACIRDGEECKEFRAKRSFGCKSGDSSQSGLCVTNCCLLCQNRPSWKICSTSNVMNTCTS